MFGRTIPLSYFFYTLYFGNGDNLDVIL